ncbi:MAG: type II toxin-antitoxin system VapC family toxin [Gammaproteobacteria bacterium]|nr:type II toxin-antitoxin system VapC family toxin [Gammaproteobacteria bacterium]
MKFVLDCSVTMAWCFEDETNPYTEWILDSLSKGYEAIVPPLWRLEVINVLLLAIRKNRINSLTAHNFKNTLTQLPITIVENASGRVFDTVFELAKELNLSAYDAAYFELAFREKIPIATQDLAVIKAAQRQKIAVLKGGKI